MKGIHSAISFIAVTTFAVFGFVSSATPTVAADTDTVAALAGWKVPGLESMTVSGIRKKDDHVIADLPVSRRGHKASLSLIAFTAAGQKLRNIAIVIPELVLEDYVPAARGTPLADLAFKHVVLTVVPKENAREQVRLPASIAKILRRKVLDLKAGSRLEGVVTLHGAGKALLSS